ncbi:MAG TPA: hypothetical protein VFB58_13825 [Chloroflexota bacterium]|nr:hypothetical protein [Chloroflexota bacterium]
MMSPVVAAIIVGVIALTTPSAHAQTPTAHYAAGWNMTTTIGMRYVGGAASGTVSRWGYDSSTGQYVSLNLPIMFGLCAGVWEYLSAPVDAVPEVGTVSHASSLVCPTLGAGWNIVGNPFAYPAQLPSGTTGFFWDPGTGSYQVVSAIPVGGSVWIYESDAQSLTLRNGGS